GRIGKQLSVVVLQRDITQHVLSSYCSSNVAYKSYAPDEVVGISDTWRRAVADRELWIEGDSGPEISIIPKVRKNAPCPCRNGKKYRECHGSSSKRQESTPAPSAEIRYMKFTGAMRRERPDFNDVQLLKWIRENWVLFARMGYAGFTNVGRGVIFVNLEQAR